MKQKSIIALLLASILVTPSLTVYAQTCYTSATIYFENIMVNGKTVTLSSPSKLVNGKIILPVDFCSQFTACNNQSKSISIPSNVVIKKIGNVKLHSFKSDSVSPVIIESDKLIIIDFPGDSEENAPLFKKYVDSLNKPIERYFISHTDNAHWVGIEKQFPNMKFYSVDANEIKAKEQGANLSMVQIEDGSKLTVDGINLVFDVDRAIGAWMIKMPDLKAVYIDHLGYVQLHVLIAPLEPRLAHLKELDREGYTWYMPGHGAPMQGPDFVKQVEAYYGDVLAACAKYSTVEEAKAVIVEKYPDYNTPDMLDRMLPALMKK